MLNARIKTLAGVLYSHEHNDHVAGMDDLRPFCFRQRENIPLYTLPRVANDLRTRYGYAFSKNPYPGVPTLTLHEINPLDKIELGGMEFTAIPVNHGRLPILGYRCEDIAYLTDIKALPEEAFPLLKNLRVLVLTALQREEHHSHLRLDEALELAKRVGARRTILTHLSHRIGRHAELEAELPAGIEVGYDGMRL
jgi:phosphoribosyl 1,2-cyclic phosphate phosphodiesterase